MRKWALLGACALVVGTLFVVFRARQPSAKSVPVFKLHEGYQIELVADNLRAPVACAWDSEGALWVVEAKGRVLRAGKVFAEGLRAPSGVLPGDDAVLVPDAPHLWLLREGGKKTDLAERLPPGAIGTNILWALDNWIYTAGGTYRFRPIGQAWINEPTYARGENALTQDSFGRFYYASGRDPLRVDMFAATNVAISKMVPLTAPRAALLYRGGALPLKPENTAFMCDPQMRLVRCLRLHRSSFARQLTNAMLAEVADESGDFLTTPDPKFSPVHLTLGPDGALYVVDGGGGAIYKIFHKAYPLEKIRPIEVKDLSHPHAWWRDAAQRRLKTSVEELRTHARNAADAYGRIHALWGLEGRAGLDPETLREAMFSDDLLVSTTAMRLCASRMKSGDRASVFAQLLEAAKAKNLYLETQLEMLLTVATAPGPDADKVLVELAARGIHSDAALEALLAATRGRELELMGQLVRDPRCGASRSHQQIITTLAAAVGSEGTPERISQALDISMYQLQSSPPTTRAILQGLLNSGVRKPVNVRTDTRGALRESPEAAELLGRLK